MSHPSVVRPSLPRRPTARPPAGGRRLSLVKIGRFDSCVLPASTTATTADATISDAAPLPHGAAQHKTLKSCCNGKRRSTYQGHNFAVLSDKNTKVTARCALLISFSPAVRVTTRVDVASLLLAFHIFLSIATRPPVARPSPNPYRPSCHRCFLYRIALPTTLLCRRGSHPPPRPP